MNQESHVLELCGHLALLSLMAVGGGVIMIAPEIQNYVVNGKHWMLNEQFAAAYAIAQAAPGPNLLFVSLIGWLVAGWFGAIATTLSIILPSTLLTLALIKVRTRQAGNALTKALQQAFSPISVGLLAATALIFARASNTDWRADLLTLLSALIVLKTRLNPVLLIAVGAVAGIVHTI
ncbi:chromate transporter [Noviherbaspirillum humi]|uniref:Chromate transporter n=1 Tax=Noviherbaspirillum humi TaxID=1688639 RepID=A0A239L4P8_9BURK|nr:chromate transporter [Noviherbaspirillum humi]SNT24669.1 chromate transporter [Noviherbaspirillum humi]